MRLALRQRLGHVRRIAAVLLSSQYAYMLEYRAEIVLWALSGVLPFIMLGLWSAVDAGGGLGMSSLQLARYFLSAFVVRQFTIVWVMYTFEEDNLNGRLSPYLLQPLPVVWRYVAAHLSEQATRLPFVAMLVGLFFLLYPAAFWWPSLPSLLLAVVFPSGLILANTRATFEAFFSSHMDFNRTTRVGEIQKGGWRGAPELIVGVLLPAFAFAESNWNALFFFFAVSGLVSIGAMGMAGAPKRVRQPITPGE
jgi:ABC-type uncharacterized transport system permease subunit